MLDNRRSQ